MKKKSLRMAQVNAHIARVFLLGIAALLGLATGYVYVEYGLGLGAILLATLTALAYWGVVSDSPRVRDIVAKLFSSSL